MLSKIRVGLIAASCVWFAGLLLASAVDGMGRMVPTRGDFTTTWAMFWAAVTLASVVAALIAAEEA